MSRLNGSDLTPVDGLRVYAIISRQHWLISQLVDTQHDLADVVTKNNPEFAKSICANSKLNESAMTEVSGLLRVLEGEAEKMQSLIDQLLQRPE